jgi:hypothetical protein
MRPFWPEKIDVGREKRIILFEIGKILAPGAGRAEIANLAGSDFAEKIGGRILVRVFEVLNFNRQF